MIHLLFLSILIAIVSNSLFSSMDRMNKKNYHWFELLTIVGHCLIGALMIKVGQDYKYVWQDYFSWFVIYCMIRFSLYSVIYNRVTKRPISYLGTWGIDRFLTWLLYRKLNQGEDVLIWLYFMGIFSAIGLYLGLIFN